MASICCRQHYVPSSARSMINLVIDMMCQTQKAVKNPKHEWAGKIGSVHLAQAWPAPAAGGFFLCLAAAAASTTATAGGNAQSRVALCCELTRKPVEREKFLSYADTTSCFIPMLQRKRNWIGCEQNVQKAAESVNEFKKIFSVRGHFQSLLSPIYNTRFA